MPSASALQRQSKTLSALLIACAVIEIGLSWFVEVVCACWANPDQRVVFDLEYARRWWYLTGKAT